MASSHLPRITVHVTIKAQIAKIWTYWTLPEHIVRWNHASRDWHTPWATNDLQVGGKFVYRMEAKDGSAGFDFEGIYSEVDRHKKIAYTIADGRKVEVTFSPENDRTTVEEVFEAEQVNSMELQKEGWLSILENFKKYVESQS